ncbi:uncharacterized protein LOC101462985 [Ceratitis capitata]|uniref:uncharacterized protein LOC101462985 n=1 Tax=Ceratitis capitata TaxID=7213 RepID=UPI00032A33CD|nr:uncharacterized protein LOC101462985 [Ceratitis capitata]
MSSKHSCRKCWSRHHTLLHDEQSSSTSSSQVPNQSNQVPAVTTQCLRIPTPNQVPHTFLPTVVATVEDKWGNKMSCRILLDSGSTIPFASEAFVQRLGLSRTNGRVSVSCSARVTSGRKLDVNAFILNKLTSHIPAQTVNISAALWQSIIKLPLADLSFAESAQIDVLIGSDQVWNIYTGDKRQFGPNLPIWLNTIFGWVVAGTHFSKIEADLTAESHHATVNIDDLFRSFMEVEDVKPTPQEIDMADPGEAHFVSTHTRHINGTYIVNYPFMENAPVIPSNFSQAVTRFLHMERRLKRDPALKTLYINFMQEYLSLGHMARLGPSEVECHPSECFYLAHQAVLKPDSSTSNCRVVFDGSCKDSSGYSLNERLYIGPPIQRDLFGACVRFRQHRYEFSAGIEKIYRGIIV